MRRQRVRKTKKEKGTVGCPFLEYGKNAVKNMPTTKEISLTYTEIKTAIRPVTAQPTVGVVIVAAGTATRMRGQNKIFLPLCGQPVLLRSIAAFQLHPRVVRVVVVTRDEWIADVERMVSQADQTKVTDIVTGGNCREESVRCGLETFSVGEVPDLVLVHDAARPLVSSSVIDRVIQGAEQFGAAVPAVLVKDTVKKIGPLGRIEETLPRECLVNIQTPQGFKTTLLQTAMQQAGENLCVFTDDAAVVETIGAAVYTVEGDYRNIKITTPEDQWVAIAYLTGGEGME